MESVVKVCEKCDSNEAVNTYAFDDDDESDYCPTCAIKSGFCLSCGGFWAGVEAFDFSPISGICPNCIDEFQEPDDDEYREQDYPDEAFAQYEDWEDDDDF